ncbi:MAG: hypothetical protein RIB84_29760 [Sneathiellaceae bacterium]
MQRDLGSSWLIAVVAAGLLVVASLAEGWCADLAGTAESAGSGEIVYIPNQTFQMRSDPSGRYQTYIRGMVPVYLDRE